MTVGPVIRDAATAEFFDGTAAGQFLLRHCLTCDALSAPQAAQCERCESTALDWRPAAGDATLVAWTVAHRKAAGGEALDVLCIAQLTEGPWWWSRIEDTEGESTGVKSTGVKSTAPEGLRPGMALRIEFRRHSADAEAVPVFVRALAQEDLLGDGRDERPVLVEDLPDGEPALRPDRRRGLRVQQPAGQLRLAVEPHGMVQ